MISSSGKMQLFFTASLFVMLGLLAHGSSGAPTALRSSGNDDTADDGELLSQLRTIMEKEQSDEGNGDEDNADPGDVSAASQTEERRFLGALPLLIKLIGIGGSVKKRQTYEGNGDEDNADPGEVYAASQTEKRGFLKKLKKGGKSKMLGILGKNLFKGGGSFIGGLLPVLGSIIGGSEEKRQTDEANGDKDDVQCLSVEDVEDLVLGLELVEALNSLEGEDSDGGNGDEDNADPGEVYAASQTEKRGFLKKLKKGGKSKMLGILGKNLFKGGGSFIGGLLPVLGSIIGGSEEKRQTDEANGDEDDVQCLSVEDVEDLVLGLELVEALNSLEGEDSDGGNGDEYNADPGEVYAASQTEKRGFLKVFQLMDLLGGILKK